MTDREAMQQALEALEEISGGYSLNIIAALRERLAQPEQEPVAWMVYTQDWGSVYIADNPTGIHEGQRALPLYTTPPAAPVQEPVAWVEQDAIDWLARDERGKGAYTNTALYKQKDKWAPVPLYTTPPAAQPEQKQDSTCNKTLRAEGKGYPRTCRKCGKGPCIADRVQPEQEQWDAIPDAFNDWWNADYDDSTNPFRLNSPAYWAWSGWSAANKEKNKHD